MDILIKGMEMPKPHTYPITLSIYPNGNIYIHHELTSHKAVALPPHGNLKDSQVILDLIYKHSAFPNVDVLWIEKLIKNAPTVVEANK